MPGGLVVVDTSCPAPSSVYCNPAFEKITGYASEEIIGRDCCFLKGIDTDPAAIEQIRQALEVGQECRVVLKNYRKDGTAFWDELIVAPVWDATGELTQFLVFHTDITERKLAEQQPQAALQKSETRLGLALNAASMGVWEWDRQTGQLTRSANAESLLGFPPGSFGSTYQAYLNCIHPEECDRVTEAIAQIVEASRTEDLVGRLFSIEHRLCPNGAVRWVADTGSLFCDQPLYQQGKIQAIENIDTANLSQCQIDWLVCSRNSATAVCRICNTTTDGSLPGCVISG
jgi:PAS domain S-box-containing protein